MDDLKLDDPDIFRWLPRNGPSLVEDLHRLLASREEPHYSIDWCTRAVLLYGARSPKAREAALEAVRLAPDSPRAHLVKGRLLEKQGKYSAALDEAAALLELEPGDSRGFLLKARIHEGQGKIKEAIEDLASASRDKKGFSPLVYLETGRAFLELYMSKAKELRKDPNAWQANVSRNVLRPFSQYASSRPEDPEGRLCRAVALMEVGSREDAAAELEFALNDTSDPIVLARSFGLYARLAQYDLSRIDRVVRIGMRLVGVLKEQTREQALRRLAF